jgi:hypothetical protein
MNAKNRVTGEDRSRIASRLVELSNQVLSTSENSRYFSLTVGNGPNSLAATVHKDSDRVSFFIPSTDLRNQAVEKGFELKEAPQSKGRNKDWFRFSLLRLDDIEGNEDLFRNIVAESVKTIIDRKPSRN